jgi:myo-inositol catabolism protein IolC
MAGVDYGKRELLILAFDHRSSFVEKLFGIRGRKPTVQEREAISDYKRAIYEGLELAVSQGVPKDIAGILVDEEFGADIARQAKGRGYNLAMPVEKSGQEEFDFEYDDTFRQHIESFDPTYVKVLVRYNPEGDRAMNTAQLSRLRILSDYLHTTNRPFLFELLVPPTRLQLSNIGDSNERYDVEVRPKLMVIAMAEIQRAGIEPTIWKLEGMEGEPDARAVVGQAKAGGRAAGVITLGRGESKEKVQRWLKTGARIPDIIGFAVGRTIFWEPLVELKAGRKSSHEAAEEIASNYKGFVDLWLNERRPIVT